MNTPPNPNNMVGPWISSYCIHTQGFPQLLYTTMQSLGIRGRPEYGGREHEEHGTERCEVIVYINKSEDYPDITKEWSTTATGFRFTDTYQVVARKALRRLCQIYKEPIARTPMKYFPPKVKNRPTWIARMEALQGQEGDPIIRHLMTYLLTLDEEYDRQAIAIRDQLHRAKQAELFIWKLLMENARAQARLAITIHRETSLAEAVKTLKDRHAEELKRAYLVTRPRRRMFAMHGTEPAVLEGIPLYLSARRRTDSTVPPTPSSSPARATIYESLSQPPPRDEDPLSVSVNGPTEPRDEAVSSD